jgi:hypothetical protein
MEKIKNRFLFFGCWNNGGCDKTPTQDSSPLSKTMYELKKYVTPFLI